MTWDYFWPVLAATGFTFFMTAAGAAMVFLFGRGCRPGMMKAVLGFAAGVMIAASVWSLLLPAIDAANKQGERGILPVALGFASGGIFFLLVDYALEKCKLSKKEEVAGKGLSKKMEMLLFAVTLHNIPEGMAVGIAFATASASAGEESVTMVSAIALAIGIGIQNFPEGAAIALPLRKEKVSHFKAFLYGAASGIVEPLAAVITVLAVGTIRTILPWMLSFAAGAMIYVVVEELVPEAHTEHGARYGTMGALVGFLVMMVLDVILG